MRRGFGWGSRVAAPAIRAFAAVLVVAASAGAAPAASEPTDPAFTRFLRLQARHLSLDPKTEKLELDGSITVAFDRYRLRSEHLTLEKTPRGIRVDGSGRLAFCPEEDPPVAIGFRSVLAAPPTDLVLWQPTLWLGPVPVFWFPVLWLRSKERLGLLPLRVAYRGEDGLLLGAGVHAPLSRGALDVAAAGYTKGGVDTDVTLATPGTTSRVRWDYLGDSLARVEMRAGASPYPGGSASLSVDALRGGRALSGPVSLDEVALRQDRFRLSVAHADAAAVGGLSVFGDAPRGADVLAPFQVGPSAFLGLGGTLGDFGTLHAGSSIATVRTGAGEGATLADARAEGRVTGRFRVVVVDASVQARALGTASDQGTGHMNAARASVEGAIPIVREIGTAEHPGEHWVTPFASASMGAASSDGPLPMTPLLPDGAFYTLSTGLRTTVGEVSAGRAALRASVSAGALGDAERRWPVEVAGVSGRIAWLGMRAEAVRLEALDTPVLVVGRLQVGRSDGAFVAARGSGATSAMPPAARLMTESSWTSPWVGWLDRTGTTLGGAAGVPLFRVVGIRADGDYDVGARTLLGARGTVSYLHPCRCLAIAFSGGKRLGRAGNVPDLWLTVDLSP